MTRATYRKGHSFGLTVPEGKSPSWQEGMVAEVAGPES